MKLLTKGDSKLNLKEALKDMFVTALVVYGIPHKDAGIMEAEFSDEDNSPGNDVIPYTNSEPVVGIENVKVFDEEQNDMGGDNMDQYVAEKPNEHKV